MRIIHYVPRFSVLSETFIYDQIVGLDADTSHEIIVLTSESLNLAQRPYKGIEVVPFRFNIHPRVTRKLAFGFELLPFFLNYKRWCELITEFEPDIIHCHTGNGIKTVIHVLDKLRMNIPILASLHGSDVTMEPLVTKRYKAVLSEAPSRYKIIWTVPSLFLKQQSVSKLDIKPDTIQIVYNAYNPMFYNVGFNLQRLNKSILCIGRFIKCKGQAILINAFAEAHKIFPDLKMTLIGHGPELQACVLLAHKLEVHDSIDFIHSVEHKLLPDLIRTMGLYIQPSIRDDETEQEESFGVAALEALVTGTPVAVSNSGGLPEVVDGISPPNAYVFEQGSVTSLTKLILHHFENQTSVDEDTTEVVANKFSRMNNLTAIDACYHHLAANDACSD